MSGSEPVELWRDTPRGRPLLLIRSRSKEQTSVRLETSRLAEAGLKCCKRVSQTVGPISKDDAICVPRN